MKTIHKYTLAVDVLQPQVVMMREGDQILDAQWQHNEGCICVWAIVDPDMPMVPHSFFISGTGQKLPEGFDSYQKGSSYISTIQDGPWVWHVFGGMKLGRSIL